MRALHELHGDVKVALDRTVTHERSLTALSSKVEGHGLDIAKTKGQATVFGTLASAVMVGAIEIGKSLLRGPHSS